MTDKNLESLRQQIDSLDAKLLGILNDRADLASQIGEIKRAQGLSIYAPEREETLLQSLLAKNKGPLDEKSLRAIYREIMSAAISLEQGLTIAYLGPEGTWAHQAAAQKFGGSVAYSPQENIQDVFAAVARSQADYGVVPIENSLNGAVISTLDVFADTDLKICAQILLPIENHLMAAIEREKISKVYSHPQVFGQCRNWLHRHMPGVDFLEVSSTARAAQAAVEEAEQGAAALGSQLAATLYGLNIIASSIQDSSTNTTRFFVLGHRLSPPTGRDRTSIMFSVRDRPGALYEALGAFHTHNLNMSKIESRPSKRKDWEYYFFVDFEGHCQDETAQAALADLEARCHFVKILGSYPQL